MYAVHAQKSCPEAISAVADEVSSSSKRELVAGLVSLSAVALLPGVAAAAGSCEFISSPSGLQFCDVQPGDGPEPVKGSLIRWDGRQGKGQGAAAAAAKHTAPVRRSRMPLQVIEWLYLFYRMQQPRSASRASTVVGHMYALMH